MSAADRPLTQLLAEVPDELFWVPGSDPARPAYNHVFAEVLRVVLELPSHDASLRVREVYEGRIPNLSSFQRAVAKEASRRREAEAEAEASPPPPEPAAPTPASGADAAALETHAAAARRALPPAAAREFVHLLRAEAPAATQLLANLDAFLASLPAELERNEFLDLPLAEEIGRACRALVESTADAVPNHRAVVAAAVAYFIETDDGDHDLLSPVGFFDDAEVVAWAIRHLGLEIEPPRPGVRR